MGDVESGDGLLEFGVKIGLSGVAMAGVIFPEAGSTALGLAFLAAIWGLDFDGGG